MSQSKPPASFPVPTMEALQIHLESVWYLKENDFDGLSKIGIRIHDGGCTTAHKPTTMCRDCKWGYCQWCHKARPSTETVSGYTYVCDECTALNFQVPPVPDDCKVMYPAWARTPPSGSSSGGAAGGAVPSAASSVGGATAITPRGVKQDDDQTQKTMRGPATARTPGQVTRNPLLLSPTPFITGDGGKGSGEDSTAGGGPPAIVISSDEEPVLVKKEKKEEEDEELTPEEKKEKAFRAQYPDIPADWKLFLGESIFQKRKVELFTEDVAGVRRLTTPKDILALYTVGMYLEEARLESQNPYTPTPPSGFQYGRYPLQFTIARLCRYQNYQKLKQFLNAVQVALQINEARPAHEKVSSDEVVCRFMHGTNETNADSIHTDGIRAVRVLNHAFGKGLYGSRKVVGVVLRYAADHRDNPLASGKGPAILLGKAIVGRQQATLEAEDVPRPGCDSGGSADGVWVVVLFDDVNFLPEFCITVRFGMNGDGAAKWQNQLNWIKQTHAEFVAEEEKKLKEKREAKQKKKQEAKQKRIMGSDPKPVPPTSAPPPKQLIASSLKGRAPPQRLPIMGGGPAISGGPPPQPAPTKQTASAAAKGGAAAVVPTSFIASSGGAGGGAAAVVPTSSIASSGGAGGGAAAVVPQKKKTPGGGASAKKRVKKAGVAVKRTKTVYRFVVGPTSLVQVTSNDNDDDKQYKTTPEDSDDDDDDDEEESSSEWSP